MSNFNAIRRRKSVVLSLFVAKTPVNAGYHETLNTPNWASVHFTVYYFIGG